MTPLAFILFVPMQAAPVSTGPVANPAGRTQADAGRPILSLDAAEINALKNQPLLREARANTDAAMGRIEEARSGYLPQVTGTASYEQTTANIQQRPGFNTGGGTSGTLTVNGMMVPFAITPTAAAGTNWAPNTGFWQFNLTASQLIYDFGQTSEKWRSAERAADSLKSTERTTQNQVLLTLRTAYFSARAGKALVKVAADTLENQQKHMAQVMGFVGAGTNPEIDLATARTAVANARVQLITAQNNYDTARAQLNQAMGVNAGTQYDVADEGLRPVDGEDEATEPLYARAVQHRPELVTIARQRESLALTVKSIRGAYGPSLSGIANLNEIGLSLGTLAPNWYVGGQLTWPLIQGGLTRGQVREAEANVHNADAQLDVEKLQIHLDVEQAILAVRAAKASIDAALEAVTNAKLQLKLAEGRYAQGVGSIIELSDAQVAMTSAAAQQVQADYNLATARAQLLNALGQP
jgi:outer membrane protein